MKVPLVIAKVFCYLFLSFIVDGTIDDNIEEKDIYSRKNYYIIKN